jgi:hypothetical protein
VEIAAVLRWDDGTLRLDRDAIQLLADQRTAANLTSASSQHVPRGGPGKNEPRDREILRLAMQLRRKGKNWTRISKEIARMEFVGGISAERVRRVINARK